jgi:hypothetical protein
MVLGWRWLVTRDSLWLGGDCVEVQWSVTSKPVRVKLTDAVAEADIWPKFTVGPIIHDVDLLSSASIRVLKVDEVRVRIKVTTKVIASELPDKWRFDVVNICPTSHWGICQVAHGSKRIDIATVEVSSWSWSDTQILNDRWMNIDWDLPIEELHLTLQLGFLILESLCRPIRIITLVGCTPVEVFIPNVVQLKLLGDSLLNNVS